MSMAFSIAKGLAAMALAAFLALFAYGVFTALDSATSQYGVRSGTGAAEVQGEARQVA